VYFVGLDLAWGQRKPTGVAIVDDAGSLVSATTAGDDASIRKAVEPYVAGDCLVAIDAPLIVVNPKGQREAERRLNVDFGRFQAGAHPSNTGKKEFAGIPRAAAIAESLGLDPDPESTAARRAIEVYPHPATVVLFRLGRTLKYKAKTGRSFSQLRAELLRLIEHVEALAHANPPLRVSDCEDWSQLRETVESARRKSDLRRAEDPVDAVVCAYVALLATRRPDDVTIYGDFETGYILTPTLPHDLLPAPAETTPGAIADAVVAYTERRPALEQSTARYLARLINLLDDAGINYVTVSGRTKTVASFAGKADRHVDGRHVYTDPLSEITDQIGVRVITYLYDDVAVVANLLADEMRLLDDRDMGQQTASEGRWGYASRHLLVALEGEQLPASVQVRTILQHAWAEFEHDIRYKGSVSEDDAPDLNRRFALAAGLLELADREFSAIRERLLSAEPSEPGIEVTDDPRIPTPVLATYLGTRFPDAGWSRTDHYAWISGLLLDLGIESLEALEGELAGVDTDAVDAAMGYRYPAGAVRRLDDALLAAFGDRYVRLDGNAHRILLLENRLVKLSGSDS
jgi:predicted RNase H-like nuclease/ppGpp synthetase/RelA/SpoT-type nucleotidyltranferase